MGLCRSLPSNFRRNVTIAALGETRLPDESQLEGAGYTFFWIGKPANDHRQAGVGFAIRTSYLCHIDTPPKGISERLMTMRIRLSGKNYATIVSAYAPTMTYFGFTANMIQATSAWEYVANTKFLLHKSTPYHALNNYLMSLIKGLYIIWYQSKRIAKYKNMLGDS